MIGFLLSAYAALHAVLSVVGVVAGLMTVAAMLSNRWRPGWTAAFLGCGLAAAVTGLGLPGQETAARLADAGSILALAVAGFALHARRLERAWRTAFILGAVAALGLDGVDLLVRAFAMQPWLIEAAPAQAAATFAAAQLLMLSVHLWLATLLLQRFRREALRRA